MSGVGTVERPWKLAIIELELAQEHTGLNNWRCVAEIEPRILEAVG